MCVGVGKDGIGIAEFHRAASTSAQRWRSSCRHLADSGAASGSSRLSSSFSATNARNAGGSPSASAMTFSAVVLMFADSAGNSSNPRRSLSRDGCLRNPQKAQTGLTEGLGTAFP